jgi:hypothetical protein
MIVVVVEVRLLSNDQYSDIRCLEYNTYARVVSSKLAMF